MWLKVLTCKGEQVSTPLPTYLKVSKEYCPKCDAKKAHMIKVLYSLAIGSLMYVMMATRSNIAYAMGKVSWYKANLCMKHWEAVKHILE